MMASYVDLIGRIEAQIRTFRIASMFRVIKQRHAATPINAIPVPSRFSDPAGNYAVLYGAETVPCSLWEAVVRNSLTRRLPRVIPKTRHYFQAGRVVPISAGFESCGPPRGWTNPYWCSPGCCPRLEPPRRPFIILGCLCPSSRRRWILYHSRFTGHWCGAIFDRAFDKLDTLAVRPLTQHADLWNALNDYDITLTRP